MLEQLVLLNDAVYGVLNTAIANPALDVFFLAVTNFGSLYFWILLAIYFLIRREKKALLAIVAAIFLSSLASLVLKEFFATPRPETGRQLTQETSYGFPSAHSSNAFAGAYVLDKIYKGYSMFLYAFAILVAVSRVYLGVHYPSHILFGSLLGLGVGYVTMKLPLDRIEKMFSRIWRSSKRKK